MTETARAYDHVLSFALEHPWAITRPMGAVVAGILARWLARKEADPAAIQAALVNRKNLPQPGGGAVAVIPMYGVIAPRANMLTDISGGTTFETLSGQLREALANKAVKTIVFDVDSPGGNVAGATEFAREVMRARTKKPIVAVAQYQMASAAYWAMAGATEIIAAPSAMVGSIGVFTIHEDLSKQLEMDGIAVTYISAGKYKVDGNETQPLSKETLARIQAKVDEPYARFKSDVSKGRGVPLAEVDAGYGEGDIVSASEALRLGMIDGIATLDETIARVLTQADQRALASRTMQASTVCPSCNGAGLKPERFMSDPQGQEKCPACKGSGKATTSSPVDTPQEPSPATGQDRPSDAQWQNTVYGALLELDF